MIGSQISRWRPHGEQTVREAALAAPSRGTAGARLLCAALLLGAAGQAHGAEAPVPAASSTAPLPADGSVPAAVADPPPGDHPSATPPGSATAEAPESAPQPNTAPATGYPPPYDPPGYGYPPGPGAGPPPPPPPGYGQGYGYGYGYEDPAALPPPSELPYEDGQPIPEGYYVDSRINKGLVIAGAVTFGTLYLISAGVAAAYLDDEARVDDRTSADGLTRDDSSDAEAYAPLFVPLAGPFVALGTVEPTAMGTMALILDGVGQSAGLAMLITGLVLQTDVLVRHDLGSVRWAVTPTVVAGRAAGWGVVGDF